MRLVKTLVPTGDRGDEDNSDFEIPETDSGFQIRTSRGPGIWNPESPIAGMRERSRGPGSGAAEEVGAEGGLAVLADVEAGLLLLLGDAQGDDQVGHLVEDQRADERERGDEDEG